MFGFAGRQKPNEMIEIKDKKDCCGCWACENVCPKQCISMNEDNEGFRYPTVDKKKCINCHLCEKVCPIINVKPEVVRQQEGYVVQNKDSQVLSESTSGGAFSAIAKYVLSQGGVVFGAALDENNEARHIYVENESELWRFRNSKYVQSLIGETYSQARKFLKEGRLVCFSGTPCQMEGLVHFLRRPYENLIAVDVVCRAVPSPKVLRKYLEWKQQTYGKPLHHLKFRDKQFYGYKYSNISFDSEKGSYHEGIDTDPWLRSFFSGINVRPSCYTCKFKKRYRVTDITMWDCFEPSKFSKKMDNDKGVTRIIAHSKKGAAVMKAIGNYAYTEEIDSDRLLDGVKEFVIPADYNPKHDVFFKDLDTMSARDLFNMYFPVTFKTKLEKHVRLTMLRLGLYKQLKALARMLVGQVKR